MACTRDAADAKTGRSTGAAKRSVATSTAGGSIDLGSAGYTPAKETLGSVGGVSGTVTLDSAMRATPAAATSDLQICGVRPPTSAPEGASTVVWIADIKTGKALPMDKREELSSEKCLLDPRMQAAVVGTTFNVFNDDKLLHRLVFLDMGTHDTLTVMPFFNVGQVVASERLAKKPGIVEVRCAQHPWTRAYIAVFDSPYYDVADAQGRFKIDSLPAGSYRVMAWHEGMAKPLAQQVQVAANGEAKVDLKISQGR